MASDASMNPANKTDQELALWMLERMRDSEEFLGVIRAARTAGSRDVLDTPDYVTRHKGRLKKLYQSGSEDPVEAPASLAGIVDELVARDLLSSREELLEKALKAYLDSHPKGAQGLPAEWQTTFDAARAEIEGRTSGAFEPGFVAALASAARQEMERQAASERDRASGREQ
jgi:Arc/MetJ-type ribon-helix-helix transcriptional regulator